MLPIRLDLELPRGMAEARIFGLSAASFERMVILDSSATSSEESKLIWTYFVSIFLRPLLRINDQILRNLLLVLNLRLKLLRLVTVRDPYRPLNRCLLLVAILPPFEFNKVNEPDVRGLLNAL